VEYKVVLTSKARRDLSEIGSYLSEAADFATAERFCLELASQAFSLGTFPDRNALLRSRRVRKMAFGDYLIIYRVSADKRRVEILRFWHGAQNPRGLRLKEEAAGYGQASFPSPAAAMTR
jgi:plasmid stabilization system protein ParE